MAAPRPKLTPSQELMTRLLRIVRACPEAAAEVLELITLVSQVEAATAVDPRYRDARRVIARLRTPLWDMGPADRETLRAAAETIRRVCRLKEDDIPASPTADAGERERISERLAAALGGELSPTQLARVTGVVAAALQE
ncbi:hypothetical protein [Methylobacterium aerolatum]|uniref:Uncharacterized protein n=1 Tax=Methylobacterium aerolatum TaxID=418708 RepID=A0ABU0HV83_9HYPH|nr:hypothetical protein [Methylobacterium aerolatum]MDQ0446237.1 hypothetical protein [Methylobacterium aerolatum]GJD35580.1 hypothetical protein FMGBMHLM_2492 [Methylobacterium aerolatum]